MHILIQTIPDDIHAAAVATVLQRHNVDIIVSMESLAPAGQSYAFTIDNSREGRRIRLGDSVHDIDERIDIVWCRRRGRVDLSALHPEDSDFAQQEFRAFLDGFWADAARDAVWINPWQARGLADTKLRQLSAARAVGLPIPPTLIANDPDEIAAFVRRHGLGNVVFKTIRPAVWEQTGRPPLYTNTTLVTEDLLAAPEDLRLCPGIYQARIDKAAELRVTVMGDHAYCAEVIAGDTPGADIDWRVGQHAMRVRPHALPPEITHLCIDLVSNLGLIFGCIDLILNSDGDYIFLEVNEMGQFLWVEDYCPDARYLEAFVQFLFRTAGAACPSGDIRLAEVRNSPEFAAMMRMIAGPEKEAVT